VQETILLTSLSIVYSRTYCEQYLAMQFSESCLSPILRRIPLNGSGKSSATIGN